NPITQSSGAQISGPGQRIPIDISANGGQYSLEWNFERSDFTCELQTGGTAEAGSYLLTGQGSLRIPACDGVCRAQLTVLNSHPHPESLPREVELRQNYPNPFNPSTQISYFLPSRSAVRLKVFDVLGRIVATLVAGEENPGNHTVTWDASSMSSG